MTLLTEDEARGKWWVRAWTWVKHQFCEHRSTVYEGPVLKYFDNGEPYVESRSYCKDCGKGVPSPVDHNMEAWRLLHKARNSRAATAAHSGGRNE